LPDVLYVVSRYHHMSNFLFPKITQYCQELTGEASLISKDRKAQLEKLSNYISTGYKKRITPQLIVICTHNSRRSHLGQVWLAIGVNYLNLPPLATYSGGTEATAFNERAVKALADLGLEVVKTGKTTNPIYKLFWTYTMPPYQAFSKKYDADPNPSSQFGAIMVCSEAEEGCPFISGAEYRIALPFEDPKAFDGTDLEEEKYAERCRQIGREMLYVLSQVSF